jgi:hypothetical protein
MMSAPTPLPTGKRAVVSGCNQRPLPTCVASLACPRRLACHVPRQVGATRPRPVDQGQEERRGPPPGLHQAPLEAGWTRRPTHVSPTLTYHLGRDDALRAGQAVSILTRVGRLPVPSQGWNRQVALLQSGAIIGGAKLWYDRGKQRFFLLVSLTLQTPDPTPEATPQVLGVDVGQRSSCHRGHPGPWRPVLLGKGATSQGGPLRPLAKTTGAAKALGLATRRRIALGAADETGDR